ncbi:MAG: NifU family protein [Saprospiraceae bacterium]|nr:NifU family protein [Saprospiraceae bacterium]
MKPPVMLYTEQTPNPESLKFVTNQMLYPRETADFKDNQKDLAAEWSPLATALFEMAYVKGVYICNNFVTITKEFNYEWADVMLELKNFIKKYLQDDGVVIKEGFQEVKAAMEAEQAAAEGQNYSEEDAAIVVKIKQLIDKYVRPAVEMDGGNIAFRDYKSGVVTVAMQGACSGCPSSSVTLKSGIEGMLKRMIPEVETVNAVAE